MRFINKFFLYLRTKKFSHRLTYLWINKGYSRLIIVFSGFGGEKPVFNYMRTLKHVKTDKLFILDDFGYRGSYYWYENGKQYPLELVNGLISKILKKKNYSFVTTLGSSKGGSCAIYFGLEHNVDEIISAACQYYVGEYLYVTRHMKIFKAMMGIHSGEKERMVLNQMLPNQIEKHSGSSSLVYLFYSTEEHTYPEHIIHLRQDLKKHKIKFIDHIIPFKRHDEVGQNFIKFINKHFHINDNHTPLD